MNERLLQEGNPSEAQINDRLRKARSVTVEFGTGARPMLMAEKSYTDTEDLYIGVNIDPSQDRHLRDRLPEASGLALLCDKPMTAETSIIVPLPDGCADLVYMGNVLGEPDEEGVMLEFHDSDQKYHGNTGDEVKIQTLREAERILERRGRLVLLETYTPRKRAETIAMLETAGFSAIAVVTPESEDWAGVASYFAMYYDPEDLGRSPYIVIAEKAGRVSQNDQL